MKTPILQQLHPDVRKQIFEMIIWIVASTLAGQRQLDASYIELKWI